MTVEQLKNQQVGLNERLSVTLESLAQTTTKLTGTFLGAQEENECPSDGLIGQIDVEQQKTNAIINQLNQCIERLANHTYAPTETQG